MRENCFCQSQLKKHPEETCSKDISYFNTSFIYSSQSYTLTTSSTIHKRVGIKNGTQVYWYP
jgi:hypothetical protein